VQELETEVQRWRATAAPPAYVDAAGAAEATPAAVDVPPYNEAGGSRNEALGQLAVRPPPPSGSEKQAQTLRWKAEKL
jgi:hypothetical protein